jgi:hypothetical protein
MIDERAYEFGFGGPLFDGLGEVGVHLLGGGDGDEEEEGGEEEPHGVKITLQGVNRKQETENRI